MSDTPKLIIETDSRGFKRPPRKPSVAEVVVWLREQGVGKVVEARKMSFQYDKEDWWLDDVRVPKEGRYLVIPLDTEPPKETE